MISVKKTRTELHDVRQQVGEHHAQRRRALRDRRLDELLLAQRQHLPAQRPADVRDQHVGDDEQRNPETAALDVDAEVMKAVDRERRAERDAEQHDRERVEEIEEARDHEVDPAAEVPGGERKDHREEDADRRRADSDEERVAAPVQEPHRDVAAEAVGAEHEVAAGAEPRRPDRDRRDELALDDAALRDDVHRLAVDLDRVEDVLVVRAGVRDVMRVERRRRTDRDDEDEDGEREEREVVAAQPPPGEVPRAAAANRRRLRSGKLGRGVERELAFSPLDHSPPSRSRCGGGAGMRRPHQVRGPTTCDRSSRSRTGSSR